jgi:hypothetical protein
MVSATDMLRSSAGRNEGRGLTDTIKLFKSLDLRFGHEQEDQDESQDVDSSIGQWGVSETERSLRCSAVGKTHA